MRRSHVLGAVVAGFAAGCVNGVFGGAGGMVLIPLLQLWTELDGDGLFPMSVGVMGPVCVLSLMLATRSGHLPWSDAAPYLIGSVIGGVLCGVFGKKVPTLWLHRLFGAMLLWGGVRYLW